MVSRILAWLHQHDRGYVALRRAGRVAVVMPALFAICVEVLHNADTALFAAFGAVSLLMLVEFTGETRNRLEAQAGLSVVGGIFICVGTLASRWVWSAVLAMAVVAFVVIFVGVVSAVLARASTALLLSFILPVSIAAPASGIGERIEGWSLASGAAFLAVWLLWPAPAQTPLRASTAAASQALATRLMVEHTLSGGETTTAGPALQPPGNDPVRALQHLFLATPWRPTGLGATDRAIVRLVDEIAWLDTIIDTLHDDERPSALRQYSRAVQLASANVLRETATALSMRSAPVEPLAEARAALATSLSEMESHLEGHLTFDADSHDGAGSSRPEEVVDRFLGSLEFSFRSRELGYATTRIASDVDLAISAERRGFLDRVLGHEPGGTTPWASARSRITSHLRRHSVWLHNSVRGALGLAIAVLIAEEIGVEHSFWVILGTLSVLRSNALNTGQNAMRAVFGTLLGFVLGAAILALVGTNITLLWFLLPVALFIAGFAPTAISFTAGQAGFTFTLVILFNILAPLGWRVGLVRLEDVAIGCAVSVGVSLLLWPRGAASELGAAMRDAYVSGVESLAATINEVERSSPSLRSSRRSDEAAAASRRLDDAFRAYVAERGSKPVPLADVTTLLTGVAILRLTADAVADLLDQRTRDLDGWRVAQERLEGVTSSVVQWYDEFAQRFAGEASEVLAPREIDYADVSSAVREELIARGDANLAPAVRILWTADHLGVVQRLEPVLAGASRGAQTLWGASAARLA